MNPTIAETKHGPAEFYMDDSRGVLQLNCHMPPKGNAFFLVFPAGKEDEAIAAAVSLCDAADLPEIGNIVHRVPGALTAGAMPRPTFQLGTPTIRYATPEESARARLVH